jgi:membrane protein DedA with SNARE-associated domain
VRDEEDPPALSPAADGDSPAPAWLLWAAGILVGSTLLGAALSPVLAVHHPLWLLVLNSWPRHQILVSPRIPFLPFVLIVSLRGLYACWVSYHLGKHYGLRGVAYMAGRSPETGRIVQALERAFGRFSALFLVVAPSVWTSALAGMSDVRAASTLALSTIGLVAWACINHHVGFFLAPWTTWLLDVLREHMLLATLICTLLVVIHQGWTRMQRRRLPRSDSDR